jgi:hypothetical protein
MFVPAKKLAEPIEVVRMCNTSRMPVLAEETTRLKDWAGEPGHLSSTTILIIPVHLFYCYMTSVSALPPSRQLCICDNGNLLYPRCPLLLE